jgi:cytochrome c553
VRIVALAGIGIALLAAPVVRAQGSANAAVAVCLTCHGPAMDAAPVTPGAPVIPRLDGQHVEYLTKQLREFKSGRRKNDLMAPLLASIGNGQLPALAKYFASQPTTKRPAEDAELVPQGRAVFEQGVEARGVPPCLGCHLENAVGAPMYPRLAGQKAAYIVQQLTNFKSGARTNDPSGLMRNVVKGLTDQEMRAVAAFLSGL